MVARSEPLHAPTCYFCGDQVFIGGSGKGYVVAKVRKNDGEVSIETVCDDCNPKK